MTRRALVLRPEPGNARTVRRLIDTGVEAVGLPLFAVTPLGWSAPDPDGFDSLLITSANAVRHAGAGLAAVRHLPVVAVGTETAAVAREAGLRVAIVGDTDAAAAVTLARGVGYARPLHLAGRDHRAVGASTVIVYASEPIDIPADMLATVIGGVALLHSARAAARFATLIDRARIDRSRVRIAALSPAVSVAAGGGWASRLVAVTPTDAALVALVRSGD